MDNKVSQEVMALAQSHLDPAKESWVWTEELGELEGEKVFRVLYRKLGAFGWNDQGYFFLCQGQRFEPVDPSTLSAKVIKEPVALEEWMERLNFLFEVKKLHLRYVFPELSPVAMPIINRRYPNGQDQKVPPAVLNFFPFDLYREKKGPFCCPFCEAELEENTTCEVCGPRVIYPQPLEKFSFFQRFDKEVKEMIVAGGGIEDYRRLIREFFPLKQYKCSCGEWSVNPTCPACEVKLAREKAGSRLQSVISDLIGKRIRVRVESALESTFFLEIEDALLSTEVKRVGEGHKGELIFAGGGRVLIGFEFCREEAGRIILANPFLKAEIEGSQG